ncbi:hypothetical protein DW966_03865 [Bacteroides stercoris]|jgi:hypothetical protein|nr:hypothetical protein DW966_03865 [Bacteroides stercoris]
MIKTKKYIYWAIYAVLYCSIIQRYIWSNQLCQLIPDIIIFFICLFQKGLTNPLANRNSISPFLGKWIFKLIILFFVIGIISDIINIVNPTAIIWGIRMIIRYSLLFLLVFKYFNNSDLLRLRKIIYQSFNITVFLILFQFVTGVTGDLMGGIWGGNGELSIYIILMTFLFSADYLKKRMSLKVYALRIVFFFITAMWGEIKMLYFFLPLCVYGTYVLLKKMSLKHIAILIVAWISAIPILTMVLSLYYDEEYVSQTLNKEELEAYNTNNYGFTEESFNRGTIFEKSTYFLNTPVHLIIGHGLGSGNLSTLFHTEVLDQYARTCYAFFTMSYLLIEVGYIGLILFLSIHVLLLYRFYLFYKRTTDEIIKYWAALGILATAATFLMIYYNSVPLNNYYFGYLFWAMCFIGIRERNRYIQNKK